MNVSVIDIYERKEKQKWRKREKERERGEEEGMVKCKALTVRSPLRVELLRVIEEGDGGMGREEKVFERLWGSGNVDFDSECICE